MNNVKWFWKKNFFFKKKFKIFILKYILEKFCEMFDKKLISVSIFKIVLLSFKVEGFIKIGLCDKGLQRIF